MMNYSKAPSVLIVSFLVLVAGGCQSIETQDQSTWPRLSLEAGVLLMDQEMVDAFNLDNSERVLQLQDDEPSDWSRTVTEFEMSLLLDHILSNYPISAYRESRRQLSDGRDELKFLFESKALYYGEPNYAIRRDPIEVLFPADLELRIRCDPRSVVETGGVGLGVDIKLHFSELAAQDREWVSQPVPTTSKTIEVWPERTHSLSSSDARTWLISLPRSKTQQVVSSERQKATRIFVFIRPVLVQSAEEELRFFPLERLDR